MKTAWGYTMGVNYTKNDWSPLSHWSCSVSQFDSSSAGKKGKPFSRRRSCFSTRHLELDEHFSSCALTASQNRVSSSD